MTCTKSIWRTQLCVEPKKENAYAHTHTHIYTHIHTYSHTHIFSSSTILIVGSDLFFCMEQVSIHHLQSFRIDMFWNCVCCQFFFGFHCYILSDRFVLSLLVFTVNSELNEHEPCQEKQQTSSQSVLFICGELIIWPSWSHIAKDRSLWSACREGFLLRERETPWVMMMMMIIWTNNQVWLCVEFD